MITTFTPNPSNDVTLVLGEPLQRDTVQRLQSVTSVAGGKGVNVSHACHLASVETLPVFPVAWHDPFLQLVEKLHLPYRTVTMDEFVRTNTTVTEPDGTTTKLNGPGPHLSAQTQSDLEKVLTDLARLSEDSDWFVLAGSLPQEVPVDWYADLIVKIREVSPTALIAVDTSDAPLQALAERMKNDNHAAPTLMKPNGHELGQIVGVDGDYLEDEAAKGNVAPVVEAAQLLLERGVSYVLVTLGAAGAVLVSSNGTWKATPPPIKAVSTVGAGDSSLAGFVMSKQRGDDDATALAYAVAYGSTAASLPGTTIPSPDQLDVDNARVESI